MSNPNPWTTAKRRAEAAEAINQRARARHDRAEAIRAAYPDAEPAVIGKLLDDFYRGKPGSGRVGAILTEAGLL